MTRPNSPRREPGKRETPEGVRLRPRRDRAPREAVTPGAPPRPARDPVVRRLGAGWEDADSLQNSATLAAEFMTLGGRQPTFGVSGWIVSGVEEPLPSGYARASALAAAGFRVLDTSYMIGRGHVTIVLRDPVGDEQARAFNEAFGRTT